MALMPKAPRLKKILGPSFILLGLGLGSGELILWPYMSANYGMGIIWGAVLGISFQFFLNMEIERYTLVNGESVFVGLGRKLGWLSPIWFIISTLIPWMWPGIILSSAVIVAATLGILNSQLLAVLMLLLIGAILTLGPVIYKTQEWFQKNLILLGVPIILLMAVILTDGSNWQSLAAGLIGKGDNYWFLPKGIALLSFIGAFAYSGAGGNLNLAQSFYIKEKGYGMGKYGGKITSILTGKKEKISLVGKTFKINSVNLKRFKEWWKVINLEHALVFWFTGALTIILLSLLSYSTVHGSVKVEGINFLFEEAKVIGIRTWPFLGMVFLILSSLMLFSTQLSVLDATSRIMSENLIIFDQKRFKVNNLGRYYYLFLWLLIMLGIGIISLGFEQPLKLVIIGAALNAVSMLVYSVAVLYLNLTCLDKKVRPSALRVGVMLLEIVFFFVFCFLTLRQGI